MKNLRTSANHVPYMRNLVKIKGRPMFLNTFDGKRFSDDRQQGLWVAFLRKQIGSYGWDQVVQGIKSINSCCEACLSNEARKGLVWQVQLSKSIKLDWTSFSNPTLLIPKGLGFFLDLPCENMQYIGHVYNRWQVSRSHLQSLQSRTGRWAGYTAVSKVSWSQVEIEVTYPSWGRRSTPVLKRSQIHS